MANWCFNTVSFKGEEGQIDQLQELFLGLQALAILYDMGQLPDFVSPEGGGYLFDIEMNYEHLSYCTKWSPNFKVMCQIADRYGVGFVYRYEETGNGIYGEAVYEQGNFTDICLDIYDFAKYTYDEGKGYLFEGKSYENDGEILEILLERKKLNNPQ